MGPSQSQLRLLSPEDRIIYKKWLRRSFTFYGTALALLVCAMVANHAFKSTQSDVATLAGDLRTAAIAVHR